MPHRVAASSLAARPGPAVAPCARLCIRVRARGSQQPLHLVLQLFIDGLHLLQVCAQLHQLGHHGVTLDGAPLRLDQEVVHDVAAVRQKQQVLRFQEAQAPLGDQAPLPDLLQQRLHHVADLGHALLELPEQRRQLGRVLARQRLTLLSAQRYQVGRNCPRPLALLILLLLEVHVEV